ncbi:ATP-binding protein [Ramlibacter algicola]|uniref:ATP-binding protein n=1 Tax=Ramlibacter algicola TaxID=2795217 RepID=A0A934PZX9_9BURK|nr:ATP-binding protein [Ramlibacter algicola]MBK0392117.1 ATP-binding protein [Ramlibacter algicola]
MAKQHDAPLSDFVSLSRLYQRSIRIDVDLGRTDALDGYVCHATSRAALESMATQLSQSNQRAFTLTGPFGGGKSSLAVALASALSDSKSVRQKARDLLRASEIRAFDTAFACRRSWLVVPVVGKRGSVVEELTKALHEARGARGEPKKLTPTALIDQICDLADSREWDGVLVLIDEMGKFLEASALELGDDVNFYQDLAERVGRIKGKAVVVGILHQAFAQYAKRLGAEAREGWTKVQGRFADIPLVAASDEVVELIGRAIVAKRREGLGDPAAAAIAASIRSRRPAVGPKFAESLSKCAPLHPAMAALLGPISKRQFGQNERSVFGFLASVEPHGFRSYLQATPAKDLRWYRPDDYWDYLRANLEPAILASPDGHRWAQAVEAVERAEAKSGDKLHVALIKNVAVIDLFRNGSGLAAELDVLAAIFSDVPRERVDAALSELAAMRVLLFKKHISAWSVFEGSDFDIEAAISQTRAAQPALDFGLLSSLANLHPVVAKRHYHDTGTMRWMNVALCRLGEAPRLADNFAPTRGEFGTFLLALPDKSADFKGSSRHAAQHARLRPWPVVVGVPPNFAKIEELGSELVALQQVQARHELQGDPVARREVHARLAEVRSSLQEELRSGILNARWQFGAEPAETGLKLSRIASKLADDLYEQSPSVWSELVNRAEPSSNSVKARRDLIHKMLSHEAVENLGIERFPAERGLYVALLGHPKLHVRAPDGNWKFAAPREDDESASFKGLWDATRTLLGDSAARVSATDIHKLWAAPPIGMRAGIMPVYLTAFLLANKGNLALYKDGIFIPELTEADLDEYLQDESRFSLRWIVIDEQKTAILEGVAKVLSELGATPESMDPLEAARGLVALVFSLPAWSQRTTRVGAKARAVRDTLLKASDPHKVLFVDLPAALDGQVGAQFVEELRAPVAELVGAYDQLLLGIEEAMLAELDASRNDLASLRARAAMLEGVSGDLRQEAFCARLAKHDGSRASIEGILSLAANKPPRDWNDRDIDAASLDIAQAALRFRRDEAFVAVKGRKPKTDAFAVVFGAGPDTRTLSRAFAVSDKHAPKVDELVDKLVADLTSQGLRTELLLAALAKTGMRLSEKDINDRSSTHG